MKACKAWTAMAGAMLLGEAGAQGFSAWSHHKPIILNTAASGANVTGNVTGFPVFVSLTAANFDFAQARPNGEDIRFSKPDGSPLPHEIESWDRAAQKAALWVKTDVLGNNATQSVVMHWGNATVAGAGDGKLVFPAAEGWVSAWHLAENGGTAAGAFKDATANAAHGTGVNVPAGARVEGRMGPGVTLANARKEYIRIDGSQTNPIYNLTSRGLYSIWVNPRSHTVSYQAMFTKGETGFRIHYYGLASWGSNRNKNITEPCIEMPGGGDFCPLAGVAKPGDPQTDTWQGVDVKNGEWWHLVLQIDKPRVVYYINGVHQVTWENGGTWISGNEPVCIGNNADRNRSFDGLMDEARILNAPKDPHWIKLDYESQKPGTAFLRFGDAVPVFRPRTLPERLPPQPLSPASFDLRGRLLPPAPRIPRLAF